jgi:hypothetical protein
MADLPGINRDYKSGAVPTLFEDQQDTTFAPVIAARSKLYVWDTNLLQWVRMVQPPLSSTYTTKMELSGDNIVYLGQALPGSAVSAAVWRIQKFLYSGANVTDLLWADGTNAFSKIWNDRATYSYS